MPQFPVTPDRERILARIPDYAVTATPCPDTVVVRRDGAEIARSRRALLVSETRHADVYYLPRDDVDMNRLQRTAHQTYCPFKGYASYWSVLAPGGVIENAVWSYEDPFEEVGGLRDYLSFYTDRVEVLTESF